MKVRTIAAITAAFTAAVAVAAVADCTKSSESPEAALQDAKASDASRPVSEDLRPAPSGDAGPAPSYLNEPDAWKKEGATQLQQFFHLSEGSEVFPYGALLAIYSADNTPFFVVAQPTFGLLAEPPDTTCDSNQQWCNTYGVPVGMTVAITRDTQLLGLEMFGFNCAACHVGELQAGGNTYRVLGGPNMFDAIGFVLGLKNAVGYTKDDVDHIISFLARWAEHGDNAIGGTDKQFLAFVKAVPAMSTLATGSPIGQALAKALQQTFAEVSNESFPPRGPRLHPATLKPRPIPRESRRELPRQKSAFTLPPTRPTMSLVASLAKTELATSDQTFGDALKKTPVDGDAQAPHPFEAALANIPPADRVHALDSYLIDFEEALALLKERFSALSALGAGGQVGVESTPPGPGRVDAFMTARNILFPDSPAPATSPVDFPRIWGLRTFPWYHWDGNTNSLIERNVGQAVVIGAVIDPTNYQSTLLIENIQALEDLAGDIPPPLWPSEIDAGASDGGPMARGAELFATKCAHCHGPSNDAGTPLGVVKTDELRIQNFSLPMDGGGKFNVALKAELDAIMQQAYAYADAAADAQENPDSTVIGAPQHYANRSLEGVWATAPYLHNGSVASLADLLEPVSARSSVVTVGGRVYDTDRVGYAADSGTFSRDGGAKGDSICGHDYDSGCGHDYGTQLGADDKKALLEYLKSL
jgi:processive rubber oxygenase RoxA-like protein